MTVALDSSTIVAAVWTAHPAHERAFAWLKQIKDGKYKGVIATHALA